MARYKERDARRHHCACGARAVDRYRNEWVCEVCLNPEIPEKRVEEVTLLYSNWAPCDELEQLRGIDKRSG